MPVPLTGAERGSGADIRIVRTRLDRAGLALFVSLLAATLARAALYGFLARTAVAPASSFGMDPCFGLASAVFAPCHSESITQAEGQRSGNQTAAAARAGQPAGDVIKSNRIHHRLLLGM
jgi:hypothetical protein